MRTLVLSLSCLALLLAPSSTASQSADRGGGKATPARLSKATGQISRLTRTAITVARLSCKRGRTSPSLRGLAPGAKVAISCRGAVLVAVKALRAPAAVATPTVVPPTPAPLPSPTPAPGSCLRDTSYQPPAAIALSPTQTGLVEVIDPPHLYAVSGDTVAEVNTQMRQCRPAGLSPYNAVTRHALGYRYTSSRQLSGLCRLTSIAVSLHVGVVLPSWSPGLNPTPGLAEQWQSFAAALTLHEQGHVDRDMAAARQLLADLHALPELACTTVDSQVASSFSIVAATLAKVDAAYDAETGHGRTQGAVL